MKWFFKSDVSICEDCLNCTHSKDCIKFKNKENLKRIYISKRFEKFREDSEKNITTKEGIIERMNRSIKAEGIFSYIKTGMNYSRFSHRSMDKIIDEMKLLSVSINIKKISNKKTYK